MTEAALVVPVEVEALVLNDAIARRDTFRWWNYNYLALTDFRSPEPDPFSGDVGSRSLGVYLSWTLPAALRQGSHDPVTGAGSYPLIPNRWLVLRCSGTTTRRLVAWVVESDCPWTSRVTQVGVEQTSMYLCDAAIITGWQHSSDPYRSGVTLSPTSADPQVANIGIPFALAGWTERAATPMFLTAVAPGNPAFSAYAAHNLGVFTFVDDLLDIGATAAQSLSYLVAGWYSDPASDILTGWQRDTTSKDPYTALLDRLGWTVTGAGPNPPRATRSYYTGTALAVGWDPAAAPGEDPLEQIRESRALDVSLGNTAEDAFLALVAKRLEAAGHPAVAIAQLRAFLYNELPVVNQPNGDALLQRAIAARWFGSQPGGYRWVVNASDDGPPPAPPAWLDKLNADQLSLDEALGQLRGMQWDLNAMWWKDGRYPTDSFPTPPPGVPDQSLLDAQLDPDGSVGGQPTLAARLIGSVQAVVAGTPQVPQPEQSGSGTPEDAFLRGISSFATAPPRGLPAGQTLKAVATAPYFRAADPVIMLSGVAAAAEAAQVADDAKLPVRPAGSLITAFTADGHPVDAAAARSAVPPPALTALPDTIGSIVTEFVLLDPDNAAALAAVTGVPAATLETVMAAHQPADYTGTLPALGLTAWTQPWQPLFVEWRVRYTDLAQQPGGTRWTFDGTDYHCTATGASPAPERSIGGISLIGPHAQVIFRARLAEFVQQYGTDDQLSHLDEWIDQVSGWRFLSQELTGFTELLAARDHRPFRRPRPNDTIGTTHAYALSDVLGYADANTGAAYSIHDRYRGAVTSVPYLPAGTDVRFYGVRQGQIVFDQLLVYDRFGRALPVILAGGQGGLYNSDNFPLVVDPALKPDVVIFPRVAAPVQLPPRLVQPARLGFALLDAKSGTPADLLATANPIGGWLLANHLDNGILLYAADGTALGEVRLIADASGTRTGKWRPPPHPKITSLDDVARLAPMVAEMVQSPILSTEQGFTTFLSVIDATLWTTDPLGSRADQNLSVLIGRPLALVRANLGLALDGPPYHDCGWAATLNPPAPGFLTQDFAVRLGDQATRDDGLIGYFPAGNMSVFNSVAAPPVTGGPVRQIGTRLPDGTLNYVWLRPTQQGTVQPGAGQPGAGGTEVTLVLDPRAVVHATTGILPVVTAAVRPDQVGAALAHLEVTFQAAPVLTAIRPTPTQQGQIAPFPNSAALPLPAERNGTWSWWQPGPAGDWTGYGVSDPSTDAALSPIPNVLVDGVLQLEIDAGSPSGGPVSGTESS